MNCNICCVDYITAFIFQNQHLKYEYLLLFSVFNDSIDGIGLEVNTVVQLYVLLFSLKLPIVMFFMLGLKYTVTIISSC